MSVDIKWPSTQPVFYKGNWVTCFSVTPKNPSPVILMQENKKWKGRGEKGKGKRKLLDRKRGEEKEKRVRSKEEKRKLTDI
jgi:hypothetical protein